MKIFATLRIKLKSYTVGAIAMFGKLFGKKSTAKERSTQSQSISGVTLNGGQLQAVQAGRDATVEQQGEMQTQQQGLTGAEVVAMLGKLKGSIESAEISPEQKEELLDYLKPAMREAGKEQPDKESTKNNLKKVSETMKSLKETTEAGKTLWQTGTEVFEAIAPWVGVATAFFG